MISMSALWLQVGKENGFADTCSREEHDESVDPEAESPHRRCAELQRPQEVLVQGHRLVISRGGATSLVLEDLPLDDRVDELGEGGPPLHSPMKRSHASMRPGFSRCGRASGW